MRRPAPFATLVIIALLPVVAAALPQETPAPAAKKEAKAKKKKKTKKAESGFAAAAATGTEKPPETGTLDEKYAADLVEKPTHKYFRMEWKKHPAIRLGKWFRADFRLKVQQDFRTYDPEVSTDEGELANLRKFRVGVEGYITKDFEYRVERELRDEIAEWTHMRTR